MTITEAINYFKKLLTQTSKKSEIKLYKEFIHILSNLESRNLSEDEIRSIELELAALEGIASPAKATKYIRRRLKEFKNYLNEKFSLITEGHFATVGLNLGATFGMTFGLIFLSELERGLGMSYGLIFGAGIGLLIGRYMDVQAKEEGRVI